MLTPRAIKSYPKARSGVSVIGIYHDSHVVGTDPLAIDGTERLTSKAAAPKNGFMGPLHEAK